MKNSQDLTQEPVYQQRIYKAINETPSVHREIDQKIKEKKTELRKIKIKRTINKISKVAGAISAGAANIASKIGSSEFKLKTILKESPTATIVIPKSKPSQYISLYMKNRVDNEKRSFLMR